MNITPAIDFDKLSTNMSAEDFQEKLSSWLQKKGLLCELRNYFRTNMIAVFSKTVPSITKDIKPLTPKLYAVNLLIAEFLALAECHYSLSVFCAEASVAKNIFPNIMDGNKQYEHNGKFSQIEVRDILEALGTIDESDLTNVIYSTYYNAADSLLMCILTAKLYATKIDTQIDICKDPDDYAFTIKNIDKLLRKSNLSYEHQMQIKHYIKELHEKQREKGLLTEKNLRQKYKNEVTKYKQKIKSIQNSFNAEKMQLEKTIFELQLLLGVYGEQENKTEKNFPEAISEKKLIKNTENLVNFHSGVSVKKSEAHVDISTQNVENINLKLLLKQLQIENQNLYNQNANCTRQLQNLSNKVDALLCNLKPLYDNKNSLYSQVNTDVNQPCKNKMDDQISRLEEHTSGSVNHCDYVVQEAQYKLKMLELECDNIMNFRCAKHTANIVTSQHSS